MYLHNIHVMYIQNFFASYTLVLEHFFPVRNLFLPSFGSASWPTQSALPMAKTSWSCDCVCIFWQPSHPMLHLMLSVTIPTLSVRVSVSRCKQEKGDKWHHYSTAFTWERLLSEQKALATTLIWLASLSSEAGTPSCEQAQCHQNRWACGEEAKR